uniref:Putative ovule protein n=1 Tax=Solanum chacoense TaxID=4108 RepID=A0A0V0GKW3_SOLCH
MLEVYLGSIRDLLAPRPSSQKYTASRWSLPYLVLPYKGGCNLMMIHNEFHGIIWLTLLQQSKYSNKFNMIS